MGSGTRINGGVSLSAACIWATFQFRFAPVQLVLPLEQPLSASLLHPDLDFSVQILLLHRLIMEMRLADVTAKQNTALSMALLSGV